MLKNSYKTIAENVLFTLNIFIIFFLLFGDRIAIPVWLEPIGRLHPVILHFPIVVLIVAGIMEFFRFGTKITKSEVYNEITTWLLLGGALLAAVTAVMGLFLSKEPGYDGDTVQYHKWFGASVVFIATFIYWCREKRWYRPTIARSGAVAGIACIFVAGHFGADITHGDNFILAPVLHTGEPQVPIDKAYVFKDVVEPIFESKCTSCHSPSKTKGGLMLTDERAILKGGKDGKIIMPGQPQVSLLLQRIHMPDGDKKHMPPIGKPQLTSEEMTLLYQWVKENDDFNKKVIDLPENDSLRLAATPFLKPAEEAEEQFDFAAADDKEIKKLNNNYRVIYPLAQNSPALGVDFYNKGIYQPKLLEDLSPIKKQVVWLNLDKMPVKDAELKTIAQFENLRTLNLDLTDITGATLKELAKLKYLRSLSLAGDKLDLNNLKQLSRIKSLQKITLWNTGITADQLAALQKSNPHVDFIKGYKDDGKPLKLNVPQIKNTSFVITEPVALELVHPIRGVEIRYTTDGTDPDSVKSPVFKPGMMISRNTAIKARAYKTGWYGSDVIQANFYKSRYTPDSISFISQPDPKYSGDGPKTLIDKDLGGGNFGNGKWIGSQKDLAIYLQFKQPVDLHTVTLDCMRNIGSQIFLPVAVEVWGGNDPGHLRLLGSTTSSYPQKNDSFLLKGVDCQLAGSKRVSCMKIIAKPLQHLPNWDPVKNQQGWVFVDELFLN